MAAPTKKSKSKNPKEITNELGGEDDQHMRSEDEDDDHLINTKINVDFEARNAEHFDFHGIRKLLHQLFLKANVDLSEITNEIIEHNYVGSVIKQVPLSADDDDNSDDGDCDDDGTGDVFGVITVMNLSPTSKLNSMDQVRAMLAERCDGAGTGNKKKKTSLSLATLLEDRERRIGLIVNERFINLPPQIALPSFQALWKEVESAKRKHAEYDFTDYLMICKSYRSSDGKIKTFVNAEEEIFADNADMSFEYSVKSERDTGIADQWDSTDDELEPTRTLVTFTSDKISVIMQQLRDLLS